MIREIRKQISAEDILKKITDYDIYRYYLGSFKPGFVFCNPIRKERTPSFLVVNKYGFYHHKDFGDAYWHGNCFQLVQQIFKCSYDEALRMIDADMNLGILSEKTSLPKVNWEQPIVEVKLAPNIQVITRKFNKEELNYWKQYGQCEENLIRENVFAPKSIFRNKQLLPSELLTFCYFEKNTETFKIYRPFGETEKDTLLHMRKWDSSIPFNITEGLENIKNSDIAIIVKAKKDLLVLKKVLGINSICNTQGEDINCLSKETLEYIKSNSKKQIIVSDNDKKGKEFSLQLTKEHGFLHCNVDDNIPNKEKPGKFVKDFAELYSQYGEEAVLNHFKRKNII